MNPGDKFLHFQIASFLGRGSFGDVYVASNLRDGRQVALKIVRKGVGEDEEAKLRAEIYGAKLQKVLADPDNRVVKVHDFGTDEANGNFFIEMEFVEGEDLSTLMSSRRGSVPPEEVVHIGAELCGLLDWLSSVNITIDGNALSTIVHGDLKPKNVRIENQTGKVKVLDFGIARTLKETKVTMPFNSPAYTSPERLDTGKADVQSDLWSVGVILYELTSGHLPFEAENRERLERRILSDEPPPPLPANYPDPLRRTISRMLRRDLAYRFATPSEAKAALERSLLEGDSGDETVRSTPSADTDPTIRATPPRPAKSVLPRMIARPVTRTRLIVAAVAGFLMMWMFYSGYSTHQRASELRAALDREQLKDVDEAWKRYQALNDETWLGWLLFPARRGIRNRLVNSAYEYIDEYRLSDTPLVYEKQWRLAASYLSKALELDSSDNNVKAALRLCEGHLARIQTTSAAARKDSAIRQKYVNTANQKFQEAAALRPKWPDPFLGLGRLYSTDTIDMERAVEALDKAHQNGHRLGKREKAQLADGYRRLVDRYWDESRKMREMPEQERQLLEKARAYCQSSSGLYQELGVYQNAVDNHKLLMVRCQELDRRLTEMAQPPPLTPPAQ